MAKRPRVTIRGFLVGAATTAALFTVGVPAIVSADGGDTSLIHACLLPDAGTEANVVIIGANESCSGGTTPLHWPSVNQPDVDSPELRPLTKGAVQPSGKVFKRLYQLLGIRVNKTKLVTETLGPFESIDKELTVSCPGTHPFVLSGQSSVVEPALQPGTPLLGHAVGLHAWRAAHATLGKSPGLGVNVESWTLRVDVLCAKVAKPGSVKIAL
jgi:hypothetical protein